MNNDVKTWECPECGQLYVTPPGVRVAFCSCPTYNFTGSVAGPSSMMRAVNMIDITHGRPGDPGEWIIRAVPENALL